MQILPNDHTGKMELKIEFRSQKPESAIIQEGEAFSLPPFEKGRSGGISSSFSNRSTDATILSTRKTI
jgi:hypothetical protein